MDFWLHTHSELGRGAGRRVGIDFQATYVEKVQKDVQDGIVIATGITAILVIIMVVLISGVLTRPISALTRAAQRIGEGDYEQDLSTLTPGRLSDEIGKLAQVFEIMGRQGPPARRKTQEAGGRTPDRDR